jgi:hypothetical protein
MRVTALALAYLDRDVNQFLMDANTLGIDRWRLRVICDQRNDSGELSRPDTPDMQIGNPYLAVFDGFPDFLFKRNVGYAVHEHGPGIPEQPP